MKLPGEAWLEFTLADVAGEPHLRQQALVRAARVWPATLYWWAITPFHGLVFGSMLRNLAHAAEADAVETDAAAA